MVEPTRELLWGVEELHVTVHYLYFIVAGIVFLFGLFRLYRIIKAGRNDENRFDNLPARIITALKDSVFFVRLFLREAKMGLMHVLILWGVAILTVGTAVLTIADYVTSDFFRGTFYLIHEALMDIAGLAFLTGLLIAIVNRYIVKPTRFAKKWPYANDDGGVLFGLLIVALLGFAIEALRIASGYPAYTAFIGGLIASTLPFDVSAYRAVWVAHSIFALTLIALVPYTKLLHAIAAPLNILTKTNRVGAREVSDEEYMGAVSARDLQWRDLLSSLACMRCGRCQDNCPAFNSGTTLSPMYLMQNLRRSLNQKSDITGNLGDFELVGNVLDEEAVWACTTCRACMEMCPVYIEQMEIIGEMRRGLVESAETPPDIRDFLTNVQKQKNPWGEAKFKRDQWVKKSDVEVLTVKNNPEFEWLWFVGCGHSFDSRNQQAAIKLARLLSDIGINYAILGREEGCCGNDVRRVGEEGLFQLLREENYQTFEKYGVERLFATSPHCYNTFKNEYEGIEAKFILEIIYDAIKSGKLQLKHEVKKRVTFHDPCYLGRYNGMYELPREILKAIPGVELVEMPRNRNRSFCCGGGGGNLVREYPGEDRPNNIRAREAAETGAEILAVACPFCMIMLEDGVKAVGADKQMAVMDVTELVYAAVYGEE
ncbi:Fe-S oxidoreductase [Archaeoglobus fulgidus DSM 8774]|uniref:Fe-S oxidoreductase n=1 Tax=Archaeoglobus fulgidus DSM 8774 TaxID=1344584 RepID=A0A075WCC7_ARCFL|nr:heterodisulfide reductase-related iron-sulfur binding cluster [Archaeoglobus fulgidus]AIG97631.1 Fe-S oxidoreductase [Archaeoglobus fulgidus DSM 8774]